MNLLWKLAIAVTLVLSLIAIDGNRDRAREGEDAHDALCAYVTDLKQRRDIAQGYLDDPNQGDPIVYEGLLVGGKPVAIPRAQVKQSVESQSSVIDAYRNLDCPEGGTQ